MGLQIGLLILESILLVATVILLIYSIYEGKHRDRLLTEIGRATKALTRQEYFFSILEAMLGAKEEILGCITGTPPTGEDARMTRHICDAIERMTQKGVAVRYLMPKFPDRLQIGIQYMKAGAEVLFNSCLMVHTMRFTVIDGNLVVLGIPEEKGEYAATKRGYNILSEGLAAVLRDYFETCEEKSTLKEYLQEVIQHSGATLDHLAREFQIKRDDLTELAGPDPAASI